MNADPSPPLSYPREGGSPAYALPLQREGPADFFPPVCLKSHWDPTSILRRTLPSQYVPQPLDPRPWTRICMEYTTAGEQEPAPSVPASTVLPNGGQFYPPGRYQAAIDSESQLRRLDRPLGTCDAEQWEPSSAGDMFDSRVLVPRSGSISDPAKIQELAYPRALLRSGPYECRDQQDVVNLTLSSDFVFNNATKQDRYRRMVGTAATKPATPAAPLKAAPEQLRPDLMFAGRAELAAGSYERAAATARADLVANAMTPEQQLAAKQATLLAAEIPTLAQQQEIAAKGLQQQGAVGYLPSYAMPSQR